MDLSNAIDNRIEEASSELDSTINDNTINGTSGDDNLSGGTGPSTLIGQDGNDTLTGGTGSNNLAGDAGNDILIGGSGGNTLTGGAGNDNLTGGNGSNDLAGNAGNDTLTGGTGSNNLNGGEDDDYLVGGSGRNNLTGGSGTDTFHFKKIVSIGRNSVVVIDGEVVSDEERPINAIADFNTSEGDKIQIDASSFEVTPGDISTLKFDNETNILSLAEEPVVEVTSGVDSDVLANTEIVEGNESIGNSVAVGGDGGDATATNGEVSVGDDGEDNDDGILDIYRFFQTEKGFHFYTSSETEKDTVEQQIDNNELSYSYEGESFAALAEDDDGDPLTGAKPVYRFFNELTGAHLYTISDTEKNSIADNLSDYNLEGVAYYAYDEPQENTIPLYRLYNSETGTHFFTPSATEKDNVSDTLSQYSAEGEDGTAFYVLPSE